MLKKTTSTYLGLTLATVLMLSACNKQATVEAPEVVIQKALTQATKTVSSQTAINLNLDNPQTKESGKIEVKVSDKTDAKDLNNLQSDSTVDINADIKLLQDQFGIETPAEGGQKDSKGKVGQILVKAAGNVKMVKNDLYATLTNLDLKGDFAGVNEVNAMLPLIVGPYMNKTVFLPFDKFTPLMEQANAELEKQGQKPFDYKEFQKYGAEQLPKDLAESKMLVAHKDLGVEKVKTASGNSVEAYHYQINLDAEGFKKFMEKLNAQYSFVSPEEFQKMFTEQPGQPNLKDIFAVVNEAMSIEVWIGQSDYHVYKVEVKSDKDRIKAAANKIKELDKEAQITEQDLKLLEESTIDFSLIMQSEPIKSFTVEVPKKEDVIDLGPMLDLATQGAMNQLPSSSTTSETSASPTPSTPISPTAR